MNFSFTDIIATSKHLFPWILIIQIIWFLVISGILVIRRNLKFSLYNYILISLSSILLMYLYYYHLIATANLERFIGGTMTPDILIEVLYRWQSFFSYEFIVGMVSSIISILIAIKNKAQSQIKK